MRFKRVFLIISFCAASLIFSNIYGEENRDINSGSNVKTWIGIKVKNYMKEAIKTQTNDGVVVKDIVHNSVKLAGLKEGDIIKKIDDNEILTVEDFNNIISSKKIGDKVKLQLVRNNEKQEVNLILEDLHIKTEEVLNNLGLKIKPIIKDNIFGIIIVDTIKDSKADKYGIKKQDVILGINRSAFKNINEFNEITSHVDMEKETYLLVMRKDDQNNYITVTKQIGEKKESDKKDEKKKSPHSLTDKEE
ncbi:MAG: PDZ domain-containing protein [Candidatus Firestonebacteria bacterium]|nr:PDZ domain-containing protein [Candidatus Firestonebacteria bacterium]